LESAFDAAFEYWLYKGQLDNLNDIIRSTVKYDFTDYVYKKFTYSLQNPDRSMFPSYYWTIGYIDWLEIFELKEKNDGASLFSIPQQSLRYGYLTTADRNNRIALPNEILDELVNKKDITVGFIRKVLVLATFFWMEEYEGENDLQDLGYNHDNVFERKSTDCFETLLAFNENCVSLISCYALAHIIKLNKEIEVEIYAVINKIILIDYTARKKYDNSDLRRHRGENFGNSLPLCGALRVIANLNIQDFYGHIGMASLGEDVNRFYINEYNAMLANSDEKRMPVLLLKLILLLTGLENEAKRLLLAINEENTLKEIPLIEYDRGNTVLEQNFLKKLINEV